MTARKFIVSTTEEDQRKTKLNANEWVQSIDLKVVFHKLLSKSLYLLPKAITRSSLYAGEKKKKRQDSQQPECLYAAAFGHNVYTHEIKM